MTETLIEDSTIKNNKSTSNKINRGFEFEFEFVI